MCIAQAFYSQKLQLGNTFEQYIAIYGPFTFLELFSKNIGPTNQYTILLKKFI